MKFKKKMLAGILSIAALTTMLPTAWANANQLTVGAKEDPDSEYKYWFDVDFDDMTTETIPDSLKMEAGVSRWSQTIEDGAMKFTLTPDGSTTGEQKLLYLFVNGNSLTSGSTKANSNFGAYEYGYKIKLNNIASKIIRMFSSGRASNDKAGIRPWKDINYQDGFLNTRLGNATVLIEHESDFKDSTELITDAQNDYIDVKCYYRTGTREIKMTYSLGGTEYELASHTLSSSNTMKDDLMYLVLAVDDTGVTEGESFYIDDLYLRTLKQANYTVTFNLNGGRYNGSSASQTARTNSFDKKVNLPTESKLSHPLGDLFDGWYTKDGTDGDWGVEFDPNNVTQTQTVYAKWFDIHKVTFNAGSGKFANGSSVKTVWSTKENASSIAESMPEKPTASRDAFVGWYTKDGTADGDWGEEFFGTGLSADIVVYAKWERGYFINFNTTGGEELDYISITDHIAVDELPVPTRKGYRFEGWYRDAACEIPFDGKLLYGDETEKKDITVYAKWKEKWKIEFNPLGGKEVEPFYTLEDVDESELPESSMSGGGFEGWYWDKECTKRFDGTGIEEYMNGLEKDAPKILTVYAKWDNTILYLDFENPNDVEIGNNVIKQLAPMQYNSLIGEEGEYGVVDDGTGNHALRIALEGQGGTQKIGTIKFPGGNGGDGTYDISYKINLNKSQTMTYATMAPVSGTVRPFDVTLGGGRFRTMGLMPVTEDMDGYVDVRFVVDTYKNRAYSFINYTKANGKKDSLTGSQTYTKKVSGLDGFDVYQAYYGTTGLVKTNIYIDNIVVKKIAAPEISSVYANDKKLSDTDTLTEDIDINPSFTLNFTQLIDNDDIDGKRIYIQTGDGEKTIDLLFTKDTSTGVTVVKAKPAEALEYNREYKLVALNTLSSGEYELNKDYIYIFKTRPVKYVAEAAVFDRTDAPVTDIAGVAGKQVTAILDLRNFDGADAESYFVAVALETETGKQLCYDFAKGTIIKSQPKERVLSTTLNVPLNVTADSKFVFYIWNGTTDCKALLDEIVLP